MEFFILFILAVLAVIVVSAIYGHQQDSEFREGIEEEQRLRAEIAELRSQILTVREKIQKIRLEQQ